VDGGITGQQNVLGQYRLHLKKRNSVLNRLLPTLFALAVSALAGCATTYHTPTYSGDLKAALADDVAAAKAAGAKAGEYVRSSLTAPMPEWKHASGETNSSTSPTIVEKSTSEVGTSAKADPSPTSATQNAPEAGVQVFPMRAE
jgi:hypothetical protein